MHHKFPVLTVKKLLKSVYIYGSYRKNKTGVPFLDHPVHNVVYLGVVQAQVSSTLASRLKVDFDFLSTSTSTPVWTSH